MSTLGKVLLFVNLLLAGGVLYLASQDYAQRKALNNAVLKNQLVIGGLPVEAVKDLDGTADAVPVTVAGPNNVVTAKLADKKVVDGLFAGTDADFAGGGSPGTQIELVKGVYSNLSKRLDNAANDAARIREFCGALTEGVFQSGLLLNLADTFEERAAIRRLSLVKGDEQIAAAAKDVRDRLERRYKALTDAPDPDQAEKTRQRVEELKTKILAAPKDPAFKQQLAAISAAGPNGPTANDQDRRVKIAQFLMGANPSAAWQKKVALTVGLRVYQVAIIEQAARLEAIATQTRDARFADQQAFDAEYEQLRGFALENSKLVDQQQRVIDGLAKVLATDETLAATRANQLTALKNELAALTVQVSAKLAAQKKMEQDLFAVQREVGRTLRETGKLEGDLRQKEAPPGK